MPIVVDVRAVCRPDFHKVRTTLRHDLGHSKAPADFDQFASRDDGVLAVGKRVQRQHERSRTVIDDDCVFGTGEFADERDAVHVARAARSLLQVILEIRAARSRSHDGVERLTSERRASEVRVQNHPGRVEERAKRRRLRSLCLCRNRGTGRRIG